jgi:hypothetical protein
MIKLNAYSRCKKCKTYYREPDFGCEICKPAKENIDTPRGSDSVNAGNRALEMLEEQIDDLRYEKRRLREGKLDVGRFDQKLMNRSSPAPRPSPSCSSTSASSRRRSRLR